MSRLYRDRATPQRERGPEQLLGALQPVVADHVPALGDQPLEGEQVQVVVPRPDAVAGRVRLDHAVVLAAPEQPAKSGDADTDLAAGGRGWIVVPQCVDQPVQTDHLIGLQEQRC